MTSLFNIGARVVTRDGPGRLTGWHRSESWVFNRSDVVMWAVVELDTGERRMYAIAQITTESVFPPTLEAQDD